MSQQVSAGRERLTEFIENNHDALRRHMRTYVLNWRVSGNETLESTTDQLLSDAIYEALRVADRYDPERSPMAWLLGVGLNVVRRESVRLRQHDRKEIYIRDMYAAAQDQMSDEEIFDRYLPREGGEDPLETLDATETWNELVASISEHDRKLLWLKYHGGLKDKMIAAVLKITPQAVRQRGRRARQRLREAHNRAQEVE